MLSLCFAMLDTKEEKDKFEELYHRYKKIVYYIALEYMSQNSLADDATQETFLKLTKYIDKLEKIDSPQTLSFIGIVTRSVCIDILRSEKAYKKNTETFHNEIMNNRDNIHILLDKLKSLPEIYRDALMLKYYFDMPNRQIADICNVSQETIRKRIQRAKELIVEVNI